ncbi:hypothetical protein HG531_001316 [Fusarium graminearum]|nr:hypothetical protein HG531_001316 [Fusarium graminearum]
MRLEFVSVGLDAGDLEDLVDILWSKVGEADVTRQTSANKFLHSLPSVDERSVVIHISRLRNPRHRVVDEIQIQILNAKIRDRGLDSLAY